jgi:hypothetical protein
VEVSPTSEGKFRQVAAVVALDACLSDDVSNLASSTLKINLSKVDTSEGLGGFLLAATVGFLNKQTLNKRGFKRKLCGALGILIMIQN